MSERLVPTRIARTRKAVKGATTLSAAAAVLLTVAAAPGSAAPVPTGTGPTVTRPVVAQDRSTTGAPLVVSATATAAPGATIASAAYAVDGAAPIAFTVTTARTVNLRSVLDAPALSVGPHRVCVTATDSTGAAGAPACTSFRVAPAVTVTDAAVSGGHGRNRYPLTLTARALSRTSQITSAAYSIDGGPSRSITVASGTGPVRLSEVLDTTNLQPGRHRACVTATDAAGHVSAPDCVSFTVPRGHIDRRDNGDQGNTGRHHQRHHPRRHHQRHDRHHRSAG